MTDTRRPSGLPGHGYSMQAAALASALVERENAHVYREEIRDWLDRIDNLSGGVVGDMDEGIAFAIFQTNLVRVGAGLSMVDR